MATAASSGSAKVVFEMTVDQAYRRIETEILMQSLDVQTRRTVRKLVRLDRYYDYAPEEVLVLIEERSTVAAAKRAMWRNWLRERRAILKRLRATPLQELKEEGQTRKSARKDDLKYVNKLQGMLEETLALPDAAFAVWHHLVGCW